MGWLFCRIRQSDRLSRPYDWPHDGSARIHIYLLAPIDRNKVRDSRRVREYLFEPCHLLLHYDRIDSTFAIAARSRTSKAHSLYTAYLRPRGGRWEALQSHTKWRECTWKLNSQFKRPKKRLLLLNTKMTRKILGFSFGTVKSLRVLRDVGIIGVPSSFACPDGEAVRREARELAARRRRADGRKTEKNGRGRDYEAEIYLRKHDRGWSRSASVRNCFRVLVNKRTNASSEQHQWVRSASDA